MMSREEYDTLTPAERDQYAGGWRYDGPTLDDGTPDMESDAWYEFCGRTWWATVEQFEPRPAPRWVYHIDLDTRRGRILWTLTLVLALALVWGTCLLMYAGALWIAGLLQ